MVEEEEEEEWKEDKEVDETEEDEARRWVRKRERKGESGEALRRRGGNTAGEDAPRRSLTHMRAPARRRSHTRIWSATYRLFFGCLGVVPKTFRCISCRV